MNFLEAIISGIVQGLTEFLPVSSSGHLVILHRLIGLKEPQILFDIFLHLGTLLAVVMVFWKDIIELFSVRRKTGLFVILATISTVILVIVFGETIETAFSNVKIVGLMLVFTGIWIIVGSFVRFATGPLSGTKAVLIGLAQGLATLPGVSRSGATISTGLLLGLEPRGAASFSFLLSIPAIIGAFLFKIKDGGLSGFDAKHIVGFLAACIVGILSLKLLLKVLSGKRFHFFGFYCIAMGILVLIFLGA